MLVINNKKFEALNQVKCGEIVHLQIITATTPIRLKTYLIGIEPNMSVILALGNDATWEKALPYIKESKHVVVRLLTHSQKQSSIIAFRTTIQRMMTISGRWLILDYPKAIEAAKLRQHVRIPVDIEAMLIDCKTEIPLTTGTLIDISIYGCAFISNQKSPLKLNAVYCLSVQLKEDDKTVTFAFEVTLKNIQTMSAEGTTQYGLVFMAEDEEKQASIKTLLLAYLHQ